MASREDSLSSGAPGKLLCPSYKAQEWAWRGSCPEVLRVLKRGERGARSLPSTSREPLLGRAWDTVGEDFPDRVLRSPSGRWRRSQLHFPLLSSVLFELSTCLAHSEKEKETGFFSAKRNRAGGSEMTTDALSRGSWGVTCGPWWQEGAWAV